MSIVKTEDACLEHLQNLPGTSIKSTWNVSKICPKVLEIYWGRFMYEQQVSNELPNILVMFLGYEVFFASFLFEH